MVSINRTTPRPRACRVATAVALCLVWGCRATGNADMVFWGGVIQTMDSAAPRVEAVATQGSQIIYAGDRRGAETLVGPNTQIVDLAGGMLLPGFHDTHVHPVSGGIELGECDLNSAPTRAEIVTRLLACAARDTTSAWVLGGGFQLPIFPAGAPSRQLLDSVVPNRPAYLTSADGHTAWVNTRALAIAGITAATPDPPPDGVIVREPSGEPQGTLRETAMGLVASQIPPRSPEQVLAGLKRGLAMAAQFGITTLHDAGAEEASLVAYAAAEREGTLTARAIVALYVHPAEGVAQIARLSELRDRYRGTLTLPIAAKIFADGVIEGGTAALLEPYTDRPGFRGTLNVEPEALADLVAALDSAGFKIHIHAIGDRAIRVSLDAFEKQYARDQGAGPRHIMAHIQLFDPADIPRFAALGVVASFQALWAYADTYITELTEPRLGPARSRWLYPIHSVAATGAIVAGGSDWSVTSMNPLLAMEVATTRRAPDVDSGAAWIPEERVGLETMLRAYTVDAARAGDLEDVTGTITPGKAADLVVLERDLSAIPSYEVGEVRVMMTVFGGRVVYAR